MNDTASSSTNIAELYGRLISDSISLDCNSLLINLDGLINAFEDYFKLIEKVLLIL
jgi:hypothetical protein